METSKEKENIVFPDETRLTEVMILSEMKREEEYVLLKERLLDALDRMYTNREKTSSSDVILLQKSKTFRLWKIHLSISLAIRDSVARGNLQPMTFPEFVRQAMFRLVIFESDGFGSRSKEGHYELSAEGLLEAVKKFNAVVYEKDLY